MPQSNEYRRSAADRTLDVCARGDLQLVPVAFAGRNSYVVKDPLTLDVFHLSAEEGFLFEALRRPVSLNALEQKFAQWFAPRRTTAVQLQRFINQLYDLGLLVSNRPGQGRQLQQRGWQRRRRQRGAQLLHLLAIRVGGVSAAGPIDQLYKATRWMFSPAALLAAAAMAAWAVFLLINNNAEFANRLPAMRDLVRPGYWPIWLIAISLVKLLHELGHALTCRHFGGRCREIGVLLLGFVPTLYCDVSDVWRLPNKWQRMAVSAAGMAVEVVAAACAMLLWWVTAPGMLNDLALSVAVVCSVGTLLINANPLLRYDGYFLMSDGLEIPNLADRARGVLTAAWRRWLLGEKQQSQTLENPQLRVRLAIYAVASKAYLALVLVGIFSALLAAARPARLENLVYLLAAATILGMLVRPQLAALHLWRNPSLRARIRWWRMLGSGAVVGAVVVAVLCWPLKRQVAASATVIPAAATPVFATAAGQLEWAVESGAQVEEGDLIAQLTTPELELELEKLEGEVRVHQLRVEQLRKLRATHPAAMDQLPAATAQLASAENRLQERQAFASQLMIRAPQAGQVLPPPRRLDTRRDGSTLPRWTGTPLDQRVRGAWIELGAPIAVVSGNQQWRAWAAVEPEDVAAVDAGQFVRLSLDGWPTQILTGQVLHVAQRATIGQASGEGKEPSTYHVAEIDLDAFEPPCVCGAAGRTKIETHATTIGRLLLREIRTLMAPSRSVR